MTKSPEAFKSISEVAEILQVDTHVLRFWEGKFKQIQPMKNASGRRLYRPDDIALIEGIKHLLHNKGMTIKGVQKLLKEKDASVLLRSDASGLDSVIASDEEYAGPDPKTKMALQNIRETLEKAKLLLKTDET
ncbi:MAG: MerR family transcriptional regulator [Alphaproteobacteria bacterium]|nr:MerR family transcriptional regulator [Alphaproteobacteria bacterium]